MTSATVRSAGQIALGFKEFEVAPSPAHFGKSVHRFKVLIGIALLLAPSFLRAIRSIPSFGIAKFAVAAARPHAVFVCTIASTGIEPLAFKYKLRVTVAQMPGESVP
jgi:hypothetical protein